MSKHIANIAIMLVLIVVLTVGAATAQNKDGDFAPVGFYTGIETAEGTPDWFWAMHYGDTFVLNSAGEWESHHLTVSLDHSLIQYVPNNFIVTGGTWSLVVIRDNQYAGTLYGKVSTGEVNLITDGDGKEVSKQVQITLISTGGLGIFAGRKNKEISGVYHATTDLRTKETRGNVNFNF